MPPATYENKDEVALGKWVKNQRANKNLSPERRKQLDDLGFVWDPYKKAWDENLKALITYKKEFGDCEVAKRYKSRNGVALGLWVISQRTNKNLPPERKKQLDDLGFVWDAGKKNK